MQAGTRKVAVKVKQGSKTAKPIRWAKAASRFWRQPTGGRPVTPSSRMYESLTAAQTVPVAQSETIVS